VDGSNESNFDCTWLLPEVIKLLEVQFQFSFYNIASKIFEMDRFLVKTRIRTVDDIAQEAVTETVVGGKPAVINPNVGNSELLQT
jgi:hypothetical protein